MSLNDIITNKEKKILEVLATKGLKTYYDLYAKKKENIGSSSTVWQGLKKLENMNLIEQKGSGEEPSGKESWRGRRKKYYGLTLFGLLLAFLYGSLEKYIEGIADRFKDDLPLVFGKWKYFIKQRARDIIKKHLVSAMKLCAFEYLRFLMEIKEHNEIKDRKYLSLHEKIREKWKKEKPWAVRITDVFLYYGLEREHLGEFFRYKKAGEIGYKVLSFDEKSKLNSIIENDEELHLYKLMLQRREAKKYVLKGKLYRSEFFGRPIEIEGRLIERLFFRLWKRDPYDEIINALYEEDYFTAGFKLTEQYVGFPFEDANEATLAIPQFILHLIEIRNPLIGLAITTARQKHEKLPDDIKEYLDEAGLEALSTFYFFALEPVKVWDQTFYRIRRREKRIERLKNKPEEAKAEALKWASIILEQVKAEGLLETEH